MPSVSCALGSPLALIVCGLSSVCAVVECGVTKECHVAKMLFLVPRYLIFVQPAERLAILLPK